jgi:DNA-binding response OmpR family regulator
MDETKTILVVDDDPLIKRMYERKLTHDGYAVMLAGNGEEALKILREFKPSLILLDVLMPVMNGWDMLKEMNKMHILKDVPVITLTSLGDRPDDIDKFKEMEIKDYLVKSNISLTELTEAIKKYI